MNLVKSAKHLFLALWILTAARYLALGFYPISEVELQSLKAAQHFDFWHAQQGPILPLLIKFSSGIFGDSIYGLRFFAPLLILCASWLIWHLGFGLFDRNTAAWSVCVFNIIPAVNLASITLTHTSIALASTAVVLCALRIALHLHQTHHQAWWLLGLSNMVAFMIDWRLIGLSMATCLTLILTQRGRRALLRWPILPILIGCWGCMITIFVAWNSVNEWVALQAPANHPWSTHLQSLTHFTLLTSPLLLLTFVWAYQRSIQQRPMSYSVGFLGAFSLTLWIMDSLVWPRNIWPQFGFGSWIIPASLLLAHQTLRIEHLRPRHAHWLRILVFASAALISLWLLNGSYTLPTMLSASPP